MKYLYVYAGIAGAILVSAVFAFAQQAAAAGVVAPGWAVVSSGGAVAKSATTSTLFLTTNGKIPTSQSQIAADSFIAANAVVGFGWADLGTGKLFAVTIHPTAVPQDSFKQPNIWHAHTATLVAGTANSDRCVASIDTSPTAGIAITSDGNKMTVQVSNSALPFAVGDVNAETGFVINGDNGCASHLGANLTHS